MDLLARTTAGTLFAVHGDFLRESAAGMEATWGAGDLRLGAFQPVSLPAGFAVGLGAEAKVPSARDESELGTDETDIAFGGAARWSDGRWRAGAALGLQVLGNPLRFANQDDVPALRVGGGWAGGPWSVGAQLAADVGTSRNPARARLEAGLEHGRRWTARVEGGVGLTPAEADARLGLALGWRGPLPAPEAGE